MLLLAVLGIQNYRTSNVVPQEDIRESFSTFGFYLGGGYQWNIERLLLTAGFRINRTKAAIKDKVADLLPTNMNGFTLNIHFGCGFEF